MRLDGRNEKRVTMAIPVGLVSAEKMLVTEQTMTVNVSSGRSPGRKEQHDSLPRQASLGHTRRLFTVSLFRADISASD